MFSPLSNRFSDGTGELAEKIRRTYFRLQTQDIIALTIFVFILPVCFGFELFFQLPYWWPIGSKEWIGFSFLLFSLGLNAYMNALKMFTTGPNGDLMRSSLPSIFKPCFKFCHICQINTPPRSHHCPVCETCVLRRDHHCSFAVCCVGHFNQRFFISAVFNLWILSFFCMMLNSNIVFSSFPISVLRILAPHLSLLLGLISPQQCFQAFVLIGSTTTFVFITYLIIAQLFCLCRGQTRIEYLMDVHCYNLGLIENVRQVLGNRWPLALLSPFIPSALPSDGTSFKTRTTELVSDHTKFI